MSSKKLFGSIGCMVEVAAVLPYETNRQISAARGAIDAIIDKFGGCQEASVVGSWRAPNGELFREQGKRVTTAIRPEQWSDFQSIAVGYGRDAGELVVYMVGPSGPSIIDITF